jgi:ABC-type Mn2+/Zn2+ transport system ATPase subunit
MSSVEVKKKLIDKIQASDDAHLLEEMLRLIESESQDLGIYQLSREQQQAIEQAKAQIDKGQYLSNDEANDEIDQWLKE